jgi:hypothetical protein
LHPLCDDWPLEFLAKPLAFAGANLPLADLISELLPSRIRLFQLDDWDAGLAQPDLVHAVARSTRMRRCRLNSFGAAEPVGISTYAVAV